MNWFQGSISEAVKQSKAQNAIFVVFANGKQEQRPILFALFSSKK
jgi:hypothetical protein